jgi:hypothetical protein
MEDKGKSRIKKEWLHLRAPLPILSTCNPQPPKQREGHPYSGGVAIFAFLLHFEQLEDDDLFSPS